MTDGSKIADLEQRLASLEKSRIDTTQAFLSVMRCVDNLHEQISALRKDFVRETTPMGAQK